VRRFFCLRGQPRGAGGFALLRAEQVFQAVEHCHNLVPAARRPPRRKTIHILAALSRNAPGGCYSLGRTSCISSVTTERKMLKTIAAAAMISSLIGFAVLPASAQQTPRQRCCVQMHGEWRANGYGEMRCHHVVADAYYKCVETKALGKSKAK
jgi:hypothetical protein